MTATRRAIGLSLALALALGLALVLAVAPGRALAQTHAGVDVARIVPRGMELLEVRAPHRAEIPVRLLLAPRGVQQAELVVDVIVAESGAAAQRAFEGQLRALSVAVPAVVPGLGDVGHADDDYAVLVRHNVVIAVRRIAGTHDVRALAVGMDRAVVASPAGSARASAVLRFPDTQRMGQGEVAPVARPADVLGAFVEADGDASVRPTADGWIVTRTGPGTAVIRTVVVDRKLRVSR